MIAHLKLRLAILKNRLRRRRGPAFLDQCAGVIMHVCGLQLERGETRELAAAFGAIGPFILSGGAITTIQYNVFDPNADKLDKSIRMEPWRAFAQVKMRISIESDPEFQVIVDGKTVEARAGHKAPGMAVVKHLSEYFPLIPRAYVGPIFKPVEAQE